MKKILIIILISFAFSDQASWVSKYEANKALNFINIGDEIYSFCEPCGNTTSTKFIVESAEVKRVENERYFYVHINDGDVTSDLAYLYVYDSNLNNFKNLAMQCDIPVQQVSEILPESSIKSLDPLAATKILADTFSYTQALTSIELFWIIYDVMDDCLEGGALINSSPEGYTGDNYCDDLRKEYKEGIFEYKQVLDYLIETIEFNWKTAHNMSDGEPNQAMQVYEYLYIAYDSFHSYLEYNNYEMAEKADTYIIKAMDLLVPDSE